jgi:integrase
MKSLYDKYYALLIDYNKILKVNTEKTESQKENWLTQEGVKEVYDKLTEKIRPNLSKKKLTETEYEDVLQWLVLSLYVIQCPRRNLDYSYMMVVKKFTDALPQDKNYLDMSNWTFYFNNYKTKKTYKTQAVPISEDMKKVLQDCFKFHPLKAQIGKSSIPLLVNYKGEIFKAKNTITRILNKIFGKNVGCSLLRNIFLTSKYSGNVTDLEKDVTAMGTSSETALNNYIKKD